MENTNTITQVNVITNQRFAQFQSDVLAASTLRSKDAAYARRNELVETLNTEIHGNLMAVADRVLEQAWEKSHSGAGAGAGAASAR